MDDQLLREFLAEAEDLIEALYADLALLRERRGEGRARRELVGRIFRHVHTIKGSAAAAGLESASHLAHEFETLLDAVRLGRVAVEEPVLEAFDEALGAVSADLNAAARGTHVAAPPRELAERLRRLASAGTAPAAEGDRRAVALDALPAELARTLSEYEGQRLREAVGEGARLFVVAVEFDLMTFDEQFRGLSDALNEGGEIISTLPGASAGEPDRVSFRIVYATDEARAQAVERVAPFGATLAGEGPRATDEAGATGARAVGAGGDEAGEARGPDEAHDDAAEGLLSGVDDAPRASASALTMLVRVPLEELDELISATHELFTDTVGVFDLALAGGLSRAERIELEIRAPRVRRRFFELEERLIELRMVPVRATLERAARAGQTVARAAGKEVDFEVEGGEVRLDKSLAEGVADPLLHLLRNAVGHGIESPTERAAAGKPARGRVRLEATAEGSRVSLRVTDDGRGIDPERVERSAIERGVISRDERLTEQQALRLIFRPGFSTASELSTVSGRGVGLDVVEQMVERAGGELRVWSRRGEGTTFELRLPTTLALVPSLVVHSAGHRYCVDARHVVEAGYAARADVSHAEDGGGPPAVRWRGELLPLVRLRALLAQDSAGDGAQEVGEKIPLVISRVGGRESGEEGGSAERRAAVVVDGWDGHSEVLVRGLGRHGTRWRGVSGATELRDGTVALMIDLPRLLEAEL
ncbi:MAG: Hpt domain-containing protein [Acidobacteria bacterium]|nr:Hpt domain-containing protein [Acidobacteriota bacterium]